MSKIPKSLSEVVDDALKKGVKTRSAFRSEDKAFSNVLPTVEIKPSRASAGYYTDKLNLVEQTPTYKRDKNYNAISNEIQKRDVPTSPVAPVVKVPPKSESKKDTMYNFLEQFDPNPYNPRERIIGNALVELKMHGSDEMHLTSIRTLQPNSGESSKALKAVTDMADANGLPITLYAEPYGNWGYTGLKKKQLIEWYKRNGFILEDGDDYMIRKPK
tara:strand:- start:6811 stop:7458 length:648 start_codon:yes stop_codon:yes gene_type:complete